MKPSEMQKPLPMSSRRRRRRRIDDWSSWRPPWVDGSMANPWRIHCPPKVTYYIQIYIYIYIIVLYSTHTHIYIYTETDIYIYICTPNISMGPRIAASLASSRFRHVFGALLLAPTAACSAAKVLPGQGGAVGVNHG